MRIINSFLAKILMKQDSRNDSLTSDLITYSGLIRCYLK